MTAVGLAGRAKRPKPGPIVDKHPELEELHGYCLAETWGLQLADVAEFFMLAAFLALISLWKKARSGARWEQTMAATDEILAGLA
ncbi:hypothetical protein [Pararhizobium sp. PWRC1-1]|uniref:hypothetical protein n=1 Tax=Pararhizobium sp. PWRC1-1 TaxID=2804566 RepID=UPI003CFBB428